LYSTAASISPYKTVPGSGSPVYTVIHPDAKIFESLIHYCQYWKANL
jgi:hypothetical protein